MLLMFITKLSIIIIIIIIIIIKIEENKTVATKFCAVAPKVLFPQYEIGFMSLFWRLEFCGSLIIITVRICLRVTGTWAAVSYPAINLFLCYTVQEQKMFYSNTWARTSAKYRQFAGQRLNPVKFF